MCTKLKKTEKNVLAVPMAVPVTQTIAADAIQIKTSKTFLYKES